MFIFVVKIRGGLRVIRASVPCGGGVLCALRLGPEQERKRRLGPGYAKGEQQPMLESPNGKGERWSGDSRSH
jgi:hypothetical protein